MFLSTFLTLTPISSLLRLQNHLLCETFPSSIGILLKIPKNKPNISWMTNEMKMKIAIFVDQKWCHIYNFIWFSLINSRQHHLQHVTLAATVGCTSKPLRSFTVAYQNLQGFVGLSTLTLLLTGGSHISKLDIFLIHSRDL